MQLASSHKVPVWYEPVSAPKAPRIAKVARSFVSNESSSCTTRGLNQQSCIPPVVVYQHSTQCLRHVTFISPNIPELLALADTLRLAADLPVLPPPTHDASWSATLTALLPVLETVLEAGVQYVVLTLGAQGAALACRHPTKHSAVVFHLDALPATVVNTSGAGDCLVAATVAALVRGQTRSMPWHRESRLPTWRCPRGGTCRRCWTRRRCGGMRRVSRERCRRCLDRLTGTVRMCIDGAVYAMALS